jgi:Uma2 family endonuclease
MAAIPLHEEIDYPTTDGQPMAETTLHRKIMTDMIAGLEHHFAHEPDVWVGGNLFLYYEKGNPRAAVAPDVLLVHGVGKWDRRVYKLWEEGRVPSLVMEITSSKTQEEDTGRKKEDYRRLGVAEYFLFDPYGDYLEPPLQGYRLRSGRYVPVSRERDGSLVSRTTGLVLRSGGERLRLVDPATGRRLLWGEEEAAAREAAEMQAAEEAAARKAAERRAAEAERRAAEEAAARKIAEMRVAEEVAARQAAELRAAEESTARQVAEARAVKAEVRVTAVEERLLLLEEGLARLRRDQKA